MILDFEYFTSAVAAFMRLYMCVDFIWEVYDLRIVCFWFVVVGVCLNWK